MPRCPCRCTLTDQTSIVRFIEDNWLGRQRIADSFDQFAGSLDGMFDRRHPRGARLILDPATGAVGRGD